MDGIIRARLHDESVASGKVSLRRLNITSQTLNAQLIIFSSTFPGLYSSITELDLSKNALTTLDINPSSLPQLQSLNLSRNRFESVPECLLSNWNSLYVLDMSLNQLVEIPKQLPRSTRNLRTLKIAGNSIERIPEMNGWTRLRMLILGSECQGGNRLTEIPSSIRECVRLEELDVSHNELKQLPNEVGLLSKLKSITVAYNKLSHLPSSIGQLQLLRSLNVARNRLVELPFELSNTNLRVLDVSHNELTFIPHELTERIGSMNVMLTGNPFEKKLIRLPQFNFHSWSDIPSPPPSPIDKRLYVPSLVELAARVIIEKEIDTAGKLPKRLERYLCLRGGSCGVCETPVVGEFSRLLVNTPCNGQPFLKSQISVCSEMCCKRLGKCFKKKNKSLLDTYLNW